MDRIVAVVLWVVAAAVSAQAEEAAPGGLSALTESLPDKTLKRLVEAPDRFVEEAAELILGFGGPEGLAPAGIETAIAVRRAHVRAREIRRFALADLDNDGRLALREVQTYLPTQAAGQRARLLLGHGAADADADGVVRMDELRAYAQVLALEELPESDAALLRAFMGFDLDGDGFVQVHEVVRAVQAQQREV